MKLSKRAILGAGVLALLASSARAQEIHFAGNTAGCFLLSGTCVPASEATLGGLKYTSLDPADGYQFDDYTGPDGFLGVGSATQNFGVFTLNADPFDYNEWTFMLNVMFTAPPGVSAVNYATLQGKVVLNGNGLTVNFDTTPIVLTADDGTAFELTMHQTSLTRRSTTESVSGIVSGDLTVTPEPATIGLMMLGLLGLVPVVRRHRRQLRAES